jgi:predicted secreted protein
MKTMTIAALALATAAPPAAAQSSAPDTSRNEKRVCHTEKVTGSLTRVRRVCLTQRQWDELKEGHTQARDRTERSLLQSEALKEQRGAGHVY